MPTRDQMNEPTYQPRRLYCFNHPHHITKGEYKLCGCCSFDKPFWHDRVMQQQLQQSFTSIEAQAMEVPTNSSHSNNQPGKHSKSSEQACWPAQYTCTCNLPLTLIWLKLFQKFPSACFPCHDAYTAPDKYILCSSKNAHDTYITHIFLTPRASRATYMFALLRKYRKL